MKLVTCFPIDEAGQARIQATLPNWQLVMATQENVGELVGDCDVFCGHGRHGQIDWDQVVANGRLRWIQSSAAGLDHCLVPAVVNSDILVSGCYGLFCDSVAEQTMALLYGLMRGLPRFFRAGLKKEFVRQPTDDLHGKTIGIVGFGGNGQRIARLLQPLGNRILATDLYADEWGETESLPEVDALWSPDRINDLLAECDVVILTLPLDASTERYLGQAEFDRMKRGAYLINVGRGRLVDETALVRALQDGRLAGAGLDVTWEEPLPKESPLWTEPDVIITPHVGAQSARRYQLVLELFLENVQRFQAGKTLKNLVDKNNGIALPVARK